MGTACWGVIGLKEKSFWECFSAVKSVLCNASVSVSSTQAGSNLSCRSRQENPPSAAAQAGCKVVQSWVIKCPTSYLHKMPGDWCIPRVTQLISRALSHTVSALWCYTTPESLLTVPNTTSALAARTRVCCRIFPKCWTLLALCGKVVSSLSLIAV